MIRRHATHSMEALELLQACLFMNPAEAHLGCKAKQVGTCWLQKQTCLMPSCVVCRKMESTQLRTVTNGNSRRQDLRPCNLLKHTSSFSRTALQALTDAIMRDEPAHTSSGGL